MVNFTTHGSLIVFLAANGGVSMTDSEKKGSRNKSALQAIVADDIVWSLPGSSTMSGEARGVDAILKALRNS
jgi:ketosteroid isomerase-like protein